MVGGALKADCRDREDYRHAARSLSLPSYGAWGKTDFPPPNGTPAARERAVLLVKQPDWGHLAAVDPRIEGVFF